MNMGLAKIERLIPNKSKSPTIETKVVSCRRLMNKPTMAGMEIFKAWGKIINPKVRGVFSPRELAASN